MAADGSHPKPRRPPRFSKLLAKPQVKVTVDQEVVFVHPSVVAADEPTEDTLVRGCVLLSLPARKAVRAVRVALNGICDAYGGPDWRYETTPSLSRHLSLEVGAILEAGDHAFSFSFLVPSSTAVWQRSSFGRVRHYLKATVELGSTVKSKVTSPSTALFITASPAPHGELPEPLDIEIQHYDEELGPLAMAATSPHLTMSSLVQIRLTFLAPAGRVNITSVRATLSQAFAVYYTDESMVAHPRARAFPLPVLAATSPCATSPPSSTLSLGIITTPSNTTSSNPATLFGAPLPSITPTSTLVAPYVLARSEEQYRTEPITLGLSPNGEAQTQLVVRIPTDGLVRPSTLPGTETRIRVRHSLVVEVRYRVLADGSEVSGERWGQEQVLRLGKAATITSCCCLQNSSQLPTYAESPFESPPAFDSHQPSGATPSASSASSALPIRRSGCLCNMTLDELYDRGGNALQRPGDLNGDGLDVRRLELDCEEEGSAGELRREKSAAWASWAEMAG